MVTLQAMKRFLTRPYLFALLVLGLLALIWMALTLSDYLGPQSRSMRAWWRGNPATRQALIVAQRETCPGAPFILPSDGFIGLLYEDPRGPYSEEAPHQGIDIFSDTEPGQTPVYAAYDGYISRETGWRSTLIQRIPDDPLQPGRQIWLYYTHMADREGNDFIESAFPPGATEIFVEQGTLLGYTGDYNGGALRTVWVHLHFSIVRDNGQGSYSNELEFANTIDPSPYLGRNVTYPCPEGDGCATGCVNSPTNS